MSRYTITAGTDVLGQSDALALGDHLTGVQRSGYREHRYRKYFVDTPVGPPLAVVARDEDGNPVGAGFSIPGDCSSKATAVSVAVAGDFVVAPSHRTLGLAIRIQRSLLELAETNSVELVLGHPNDAARRILTRLGYHSLAHRERHVRFFGRGLTAREPSSAFRVFERTRPGRCARSVRARAAGASGGNVDWVDRFDDRFTEVWSVSSKKSRVVSERTAALLNWRYELQAGAMTGRFRLAAFGRDGQVRAYLVLQEDGSTWRIMEIVGVDDRSQEILLAGVLAHARAAGATMLVLSSFAVSDELARALRRLQFVRRKTSADPARARGLGSVPLVGARSDRLDVRGRRSRPVAGRRGNRRRPSPAHADLSCLPVACRHRAALEGDHVGEDVVERPRRRPSRSRRAIFSIDGIAVEHVLDPERRRPGRTGRERAPSPIRSARARAVRARRSRCGRASRRCRSARRSSDASISPRSARIVSLDVAEGPRLAAVAVDLERRRRRARPARSAGRPCRTGRSGAGRPC